MVRLPPRSEWHRAVTRHNQYHQWRLRRTRFGDPGRVVSPIAVAVAADDLYVMQLTDTDDSLKLDEEIRVVLWHIATLGRAGYDDETAVDLALDKSVDLHLAVGLIERGCRHNTALRILL